MKKLSIEYARKLATTKNGKCLSDCYDPYCMTFMCSEGHIWNSPPNNIIRDNSWCQQCHVHNNISVCSILTQDVLIQECYDSTSFQQIADKYNITQATVRIYYKKYGIVPNFPRKKRSVNQPIILHT